jgi:hypothetical protein
MDINAAAMAMMHCYSMNSNMHRPGNIVNALLLNQWQQSATPNRLSVFPHFMVMMLNYRCIVVEWMPTSMEYSKGVLGVKPTVGSSKV